jgi:hypothetical protein
MEGMDGKDGMCDNDIEYRWGVTYVGKGMYVCMIVGWIRGWMMSMDGMCAMGWGMGDG